MANKNIEVEMRGLLDESSRKKLLDYLGQFGKLTGEQNRFLIDYSTFIEGVGERKKDIRIRVTNGDVELIVKEGKFGGASRRETSIFVANNDLASALYFMYLLGYKKGVAAIRKIIRYEVEGMELSIHEVVNYNAGEKIHGYFFEAEIMADEALKNRAKEKIIKFLHEQGLSFFNEEEWNAYIEKLNKEANGVFDYDKDKEKIIADLGKKGILN